MSSTNRGSDRDESDFYESPAWAIRAILAELGAGPSRILEPTAGRGAIVKELMEHWPNSGITAVELDKARFDILHKVNTVGPSFCCDFLTNSFKDEEPIPGFRFDLGITNPPFKLATDVIEQTILVCRETVMLTRLNFLASMERDDFWKAHPADVYVLPKRPSFCASLKCLSKKDKDRAKTLEPCDWHQTLYLDAPRPTRCPFCGAKIHVTTSDSCEYAWIAFGPGRGGRWKRLTCE